MPIYRPELEKEHGDAGETDSNQTGYNFANLYQMNRQDGANSQLAQKANDTARAANVANSQFDTASASGDSKSLGDAVSKLKGIANNSQNFSVQSEAMKGGASPYQAGIEGFYSGQGNPYAAKIQSYGNIYQQAMGRVPPTTRKDLTPGTVDKPKPPNKPSYQDDLRRTDILNSSNRSNKVVNMDTLSWGLKSGRITSDEYYRAQNDPAFYQELVQGRLA